MLIVAASYLASGHVLVRFSWYLFLTLALQLLAPEAVKLQERVSCYAIISVKIWYLNYMYSPKIHYTLRNILNVGRCMSNKNFPPNRN